jgi:Mlc titration factor MtfA (ptsG expression regulator)
MLVGVLIMLSPLLLVLFKIYIEPKIKENIQRKKWNSNWGETTFLTYDGYLCKHISYYKRLSLEGKKKFVIRIYNFINDVVFYGKGGELITEEKKVVISASAIQLTFGYKEYLFYSFRYIFVYPKAFFSKIYNGYLKGGTYPTGAVAFSWEDFKYGYELDDDKMNLGLHEMAHTLLMQVSDDKFDTYIDSWFSVGRSEFLNIQQGNSAMFRSYAGTNRYEFLSVAIECFFESPKEFEIKLPEIYNSLKVLLNQDPQNIKSDYVLDEETVKTLKDITKQDIF